MFRLSKFTLLFVIYLVTINNLFANNDDKPTINWMSWEEAMLANKENPKPIFIHIYAEWNGYCKLMNKVAFSDQGIIQYLDDHFYAVKLNGEHTDDITWKGQTFNKKETGKIGVHELFTHLIDGEQAVYPTFIFLDVNQDKQLVAPGYRTADRLLPELTFIAEKQYEEYTLEAFLEQQKIPIATETKQNAIDKSTSDCNILEFETTELDFGTNADPNDVVMIDGVQWIKQNSNPVRELKFKNISDQPVSIFVKSTIGALIPKYKGRPIQPGEESIIEVRYNTKRLGEKSMKLKIMTESCNYDIGVIARTIK